MGFSRALFPTDLLAKLIKNVTALIPQDKQEVFAEKVQDIIYTYRSDK